MVFQQAKRYFRVRSEPLCARHAKDVDGTPGVMEGGGIMVGVFPAPKPKPAPRRVSPVEGGAPVGLNRAERRAQAKKRGRGR